MILKKTSLFLLFLTCTIACKGKQDKKLQTEETLETYKECLTTSNKELIKDVVAEEFRLGIYEGANALHMFEAFLDGVKAPDSIYWEGLQQDGDELYCEVYYKDGEKLSNSRVTFSESGKLLFSDLLDQKVFRMHRRKESKYVTAVPFEVKNDKIIIKARLNNTDKVLNMLFDTGADGMALVKDLQEACNVKITSQQSTRVPGGEMQVEKSNGNLLQLDSITIPRQNLVLFKAIAPGIDGIIGGRSFFGGYITELDFDKHEIRLYEQGKFSIPESYKASDMRYDNGVPTVSFDIYKDTSLFKSEFIFDTGAGYEAILFGVGMKELAKDSILKVITPEFYSYNYSVGYRSRISIGKVDSLVFTNMCFENTYLAMEAYNENNHGRHKVNGSIGIKALRRFNWIIDLTNYKIYSAPNKQTFLPMDFVLDGHMLGYVGEELRVLRPVKKTDGAKIKVGDVVVSINGLDPLTLDSKKLNELLNGNPVNLLLWNADGDKENREVTL